MSEDIGHFGHAYGTMLWHHMQALRKDDEPLRKRIFDAIECMREVEPEATAAWEAQFPTVVYSGRVIDAGIFPGLPETYESALPQFWVLKNDRDPLGGKVRFIWDFNRGAWVWDSKA